MGLKDKHIRQILSIQGDDEWRGDLERLENGDTTLTRHCAGESDFKTMARFYNGPAYAKHFYHERLQRWFREFKYL